LLLPRGKVRASDGDGGTDLQLGGSA